MKRILLFVLICFALNSQSNRRQIQYRSKTVDKFLFQGEEFEEKFDTKEMFHSDSKVSFTELVLPSFLESQKTLVEEGEISLPSSSIHQVGVFENYAYLANSDKGFQVVDVSDNEDLKIVGNDDKKTKAFNIEIRDETLVLMVGGYGIYAYDCSDPSLPNLLDYYLFEQYSWVKGTYLHGDTLYVCGDTFGFGSFNISNNGNNITLIEKYETFNGMRSLLLFKEKNVLFLGHSKGIKAFDVSKGPKELSRIGSYTITKDNLVYSLERLKDDLLVGTVYEYGTIIWNVSDVTSITQISEYSEFSLPMYDSVVVDNYILTGVYSENFIAILDISDITSPKLTQKFATNYPRSLIKYGDYIYVGGGTLRILNFYSGIIMQGICDAGTYPISLTACNEDNECLVDSFDVIVSCQNLVCSDEKIPNLNCTECFCKEGYSGDKCDLFNCSKLCIHGECTGPNTCSCNDFYNGTYCESFDCSIVICENGGTCSGPNICTCESFLFYGDHCENSMLLYIVLVPSGSVIGLVFFGLLIGFICVYCGNLQKNKKLKVLKGIEDVETVLEEIKMEQESSKTNFITNAKINKSVFQIDTKDIKLIKHLAKGGSESQIFLCDWQGKSCAYKKFNVSNVFETKGDDFEEFEKELAIFISISHPSIVQFYGASFNPPNVGLLMEYCENGDIPQFLFGYKTKHGKNYDLLKKLNFMKEISQGLEYLHSRSIIHRDLKPQNCLVNKFEEIKIIDFGLSKISENSKKTMTKQIGTAFYMAPEVFNGRGNYSFPCDVFSFSILCFSVITEEFNPYGTLSGALSMEKVSKDPNFRPDFNKTTIFGEVQFLQELIKKNWDQNPEKRDSFKEITGKLTKEIEKMKKMKKN